VASAASDHRPARPALEDRPWRKTNGAVE